MVYFLTHIFKSLVRLIVCWACELSTMLGTIRNMMMADHSALRELTPKFRGKLMNYKKISAIRLIQTWNSENIHLNWDDFGKETRIFRIFSVIVREEKIKWREMLEKMYKKKA